MLAYGLKRLGLAVLVALTVSLITFSMIYVSGDPAIAIAGEGARAEDIEMRMKQGFSVFVINWGEPGFKTIDIGRRVAGRPATNP